MLNHAQKSHREMARQHAPVLEMSTQDPTTQNLKKKLPRSHDLLHAFSVEISESGWIEYVELEGCGCISDDEESVMPEITLDLQSAACRCNFPRLADDHQQLG